MVLSSLTTEYIRVQVVAEKDGVTANPTGDVVQLAFPSRSVNPITADWNDAVWETVVDPVSGVPSYYAKCLVGPSGGAIALPVGKYDVWVRVTDSPEIPTLKAGELLVN